MTNTITQRFNRLWQGFADSLFTRKENGDYVKQVMQDVLRKELSSLFTKFEEIMDIYEGMVDQGELMPWNSRETFTKLADQRQKLAELKKEYTGGEK